jgi:hypothetical protein
MILALFIFGFTLMALITGAISSVLLKKTSFSKSTRKVIFILLNAFLLYPCAIPAGIMFGIVGPNIVLLGASVFTGSLLDYFSLIANSWIFQIISFSATSLSFYILSFIFLFELKTK